MITLYQRNSRLTSDFLLLVGIFSEKIWYLMSLVIAFERSYNPNRMKVLNLFVFSLKIGLKPRMLLS